MDSKEKIGAVMRRQPVIIVLAVLQFLLGTGGLYGGYMLLSDFSGAKLGVPLSLLDNLPINNFLIPGLVLAIVLGIMPLIISIGILRKNTFIFFEKVNILPTFHWAYTFSVFTACFLAGWTTGELILWGANSLSVIYLIWGIMTLLLCLIAKVRNYYRNQQ